MTGAAGFVGRRLVAALLERGWEVWGLARPESSGRAAAPAPAARFRPLAADVRDPAAIAAAVEASTPDAVVHLAGVSFEPHAQRDPATAYETNVTGAAVLLHALAERRAAGALDPRVLVVGSGHQYGRHDRGDRPLAEDTPQRPVSVYAASKAAQEIVALQVARATGLAVIATRSFNHSGPTQRGPFLLPALARRVREASAAGASTIPIGNTAPVRDWLHVDDVVAAYVALLERGAPGEAYNVASGEGVSVGDLATRLIARAGAAISLAADPALQRPVDVPVLVGDSSKLRAATGWSPRRSLDDLLDDLLRAEAH